MRVVRWFPRGTTRLRLDLVALAVAAIVIGAPALLANDGFAPDYTNHLWLVWVQGKEIAAHGLPSYFLEAQNTGGTVNPFFVFYGGTLYSVTGAFAAVL